MRPERVVVDTNVFISAVLITGSVPARALDKALDGQLLVSTATLTELAAKLLLPKLDRYVAREKRLALLDRLASVVEVVEIVSPVRACRDPRDDKFLEVAINGYADVIVSGDLDLLALNPFQGIAILSPAAYESPVDR